MKPIILTKLDYTRIKKNLKKALSKRTITQKEADRLLEEINSAQLVESSEIASDIVTMNSIVRIKFINQNHEIQLQIVYPKDVDSNKNKVSIFSPIATALIGYKEGDEIEWVVPAGITKMKIMEIVYQPEKEGALQI